MEHLKDTLKHPNLHIGMRNVKTALTATLCALLYFPFGRNPTFACIGAVFGMGYDMAGSKLHGGNRLFGTAFGGLIAMAMFRIYIIFYPDGRTSPLMMLFLFFGVILLILVSQNLWPGAVQPGSVVLCIIFFNTPVETYVSYSLNRIFDTGVGVMIAIIVNYLLPRERLVKWLEVLHLRKRLTPEKEYAAGTMLISESKNKDEDDDDGIEYEDSGR